MNQIQDHPIKNPGWRLFAVLLCLGPVCGLAADIRVTATLQPSEIALGEAAQLTVNIEGSANAPLPQLSAVDGLEFNHVGRSINVQFINGVMSGGVIHTYQVTPLKAGVFVIPEITLTVGRDTAKTQPLRLRVGKQAYSVPLSAPPAQPTPRSGAAPSANTPSNPSSGSLPREIAMIRLEYPRRDFYLGEMAPAKVKIYLHPQLQIVDNSAPTLTGNAFTFSKLQEETNAVEKINDVEYRVHVLPTAIAPVIAGEHPLGAKIDITTLMRKAARRSRSLFDGGFFNFDDDIFDSFLGRVQQKTITLKTEDITVKVLPLPKEGQTVDFAGAIGRFDLNVSASPKEVTAGDPITLKMIVSGSGNFDRVQAPELEKKDGFKLYTASAKMETNEAGYEGRKIFEQPIVPQNPEARQIPPLRFSFFDPENRKYVALSSPPIPLRVTPSPATASVASAPSPAPPSASGGAGADNRSPPSGAIHGSLRTGAAELVSNKLEMGAVVSTLAPVIDSPWFWGGQCLPLAALAVAWGVARRRDRLATDRDFARAVFATRAVRAHLEALDDAMRKDNAQGFFDAARRALQERLGERFDVKPESITLSEVESRLAGNPEIVAEVGRVFEAADQVSYSGQHFSSETLRDWRGVVLDALKRLENRR
ncbi:MAG: protein BatD [Verrucomicrobia bacterium]|nr:protein BatD [Verrucomicrobiota bacterium]